MPLQKLIQDSFRQWIVEELVEAPAELYAQGGWMELKRGLRQLRDAGFHVTLDMHALPGVSASNQMFAGNVTSDVQFYKDHNYQRALTWSAVLTSMSHLDPDFSSVVAIECINEPLSDVRISRMFVYAVLISNLGIYVHIHRRTLPQGWNSITQISLPSLASLNMPSALSVRWTFESRLLD
jgi:aryl-phospho-beta-D-glucosidase BglC (GH1 family)